MCQMVFFMPLTAQPAQIWIPCKQLSAWVYPILINRLWFKITTKYIFEWQENYESHH